MLKAVSIKGEQPLPGDHLPEVGDHLPHSVTGWGRHGKQHWCEGYDGFQRAAPGAKVQFYPLQSQM